MKTIISEMKAMFSNVCYVFKNALDNQGSVIVNSILCALIAVAISLLQLFSVPAILKAIEVESPYSIIVYVSIFIVAWMLFDSMQTYINANIIFGRLELRSFYTIKIHSKMANTSYPNTEKKDFLDLLDRAINTVNDNEGAVVDIWNVFTQLIQSLLGLIIFIFLMTKVDVWLVLVTLITSLLGYFIKIRANKWIYENEGREAELSRKIAYSNSVAQKLSLAKDIRIFNMKDWLRSIKDHDFEDYKIFLKEKESNSAIVDVKKLGLSVFRSSFAYVYLIFFMISNHMDISLFLLMLNAVTGFEAWVEGLLSAVTKLNEHSIQISYVRKYLDYPEVFKYDGGKEIEKKETYGISLKNIFFTYPKADKECIKNIDLEITPGEKIAIVGLNGAGKTTIVKLICGLLEPDNGEILLDGENICNFDRDKFYKLFSCVFQESSMLAGSLACNIAQSSDDINMERVKRCAEEAGLYEKIVSLPDGFESNIGKEVYDDAIDLSGGELQSLLLARALYKDGKILILDEPTAALDPLAEKAIYEKYASISNNKTSFFISHRLASTRFCDRIILIEDGIIAEQGTHDELMAVKGKYYKLFETQSKYYQEG